MSGKLNIFERVGFFLEPFQIIYYRIKFWKNVDPSTQLNSAGPVVWNFLFLLWWWKWAFWVICLFFTATSYFVKLYNLCGISQLFPWFFWSCPLWWMIYIVLDYVLPHIYIPLKKITLRIWIHRGADNSGRRIFMLIVFYKTVLYLQLFVFNETWCFFLDILSKRSIG